MLNRDHSHLTSTVVVVDGGCIERQRQRFQDSLGGDSKTLMLLQINPCASHVEARHVRRAMTRWWLRHVPTAGDAGDLLGESQVDLLGYSVDVSKVISTIAVYFLCW